MKRTVAFGLLLGLSLAAQAHTDKGPWLSKYRGRAVGSICTCSKGNSGVVPLKNQRYNRDSEWFAVAPGVVFSDFESCYQFLDDNYNRLSCGFLAKY